MQFPFVSIILYLLWAFNIRLLYDSLLFEFPSNEFIFIGNGNMIFHKDLAQFSNKLVYKTGIRRSTIELL